ncbi:hypothetical protein PBI_DYLAN_47 [Mycobacterium phage Dylan]|uniref:Uncharacterized protein n=1 Tax=Mycobacterium phage Dylan TaxID=1340831 RepID=S5ZH76_9CAUD|nr:hypothetical protein PBI_DYLAN_47 [Mycobacterium phage Dylan]AGT20677.1 hypothetical protein PBI_DYLAN_47 [Mycobacterium phage Dylan]
MFGFRTPSAGSVQRRVSRLLSEVVCGCIRLCVLGRRVVIGRNRPAGVPAQDGAFLGLMYGQAVRARVVLNERPVALVGNQGECRRIILRPGAYPPAVVIVPPGVEPIAPSTIAVFRAQVLDV